MAINILQTVDLIEVMENFIERKRPREEMRHLVDLSWKIEGQSVIVFEIRPAWSEPGKTIEANIAKATYIKAKDRWKVFWLRASLKWEAYQPHPETKTLAEFLALVEEDKLGCFWG